MDIHVVQPGDTIDSIANMYGISVDHLIKSNELENPYDLVIGQTIVIAYPKQIHVVNQGDSFASIAAFYGITIMQLFRNNPSLSTRNSLISGETLVISYDTIGQITTIGFAYPFIEVATLRKTLPFLSYLSIFNYTTTEEGEIISYFDDIEMIKIAKEYGVAPLMLLTTLTEQGEPNIELAYTILLNEEYQDRNIEKLLSTLKTKGYYGLNLVFNYLNTTNQILYLNFIRKISNRLRNEGYQIFLTINTNIQNIDNEITFEKVDYSSFSQYVDAMIFLQFIWGKNYGPPSPVSSITNLRSFVEYVLTMVSPDKIIMGKPIISYDWELPYIPGRSSATSLTLNASLSLANDVDAIIQFDETSYTPYFYYYNFNFGIPIQHLVWSIDARSIDILDDLVEDNNLHGTAIWTIMVYFPQLWLLLTSQYVINKVLPEI